MCHVRWKRDDFAEQSTVALDELCHTAPIERCRWKAQPTALWAQSRPLNPRATFNLRLREFLPIFCSCYFQFFFGYFLGPVLSCAEARHMIHGRQPRGRHSSKVQCWPRHSRERAVCRDTKARMAEVSRSEKPPLELGARASTACNHTRPSLPIV